MTPLIAFHILAGTVAMLSGAAAMIVRKGARWHLLTGNFFVVSMLGLSASGSIIGFARDQPLNGFMGLLTFYLVSTAWLTARRRDGKTRPIDWAVLAVPLGVGAGLIANGLEAAGSPTGAKGGFSAPGYFVFASIALLLAFGDLRMLLRGGVFGKHRIARHLVRMGLSLRHRAQPGTKDALEAQDRARALELQLLDARIQHDQLQKQLDWHTKMLAAQDSPKPRVRDANTDTIVQPA